MFWMIAGLLAAIVAMALVLPLALRRRAALPDAAAHDRAVYRDQLAEVERDRASGLLGEDAAAAARLEIQRRILRTDRQAGAAPAVEDPAAAGPSTFLAALLALLVPAAALGLYFLTGTPGMPDMPLAQRLRDAPMLAQGSQAERMRAAGEMDAKERAEMIAGMVDGLEARLADSPDDFDGWMQLGRSRLVLGEPVRARDAYARAAALQPDSLPAATAYAAAVLQSDGNDEPLSPQAEVALRRVLAIEPKEPSALFLMGRAASEKQDWPAALDWFRRLLAVLPPEDERTAVVSRIVQELHQREAGKAPAGTGGTLPGNDTGNRGNGPER